MKVLVTSKSFGKTNPAAIDALTSRGLEVSWSDVPSPTPADIARQIVGCDGLIVGNDTVDASVFDAADRLKVVHMHGTGVDAIDVAAATERGVLVANAPGANRNAVAEMTVSLMLALGRRLDKHAALLREGRWERTAGHEVSGSTVGVIGLGNIGKRVVELLKGFEVKTIGFDPMADFDWAERNSVELRASCDSLFSESDWIILTAPLTPKTEKLVNARTIALMKPSAYIINTARGGLVDEEALCEAMRSKRIGGAALDAYREEPLPHDSPLRSLDFLLTPHIAATSIETAGKVSGIVASNVAAILLDGKVTGAVNADSVIAARAKKNE